MPYTEQERTELVRLLRRAAPSPKAKATPSLDGMSDELRRSTRAVYELERAARDCIDEFGELRGGVLDERLETVRKVESLQRDVRSISEKMQEPTVRQALAEYGGSFPDKADRMLELLIEACVFYVVRNSRSPGGIKAEGKAHSKELASKILNEFLVHASVSWRDATGKKPKPNKSPDGTPSGPYGRFVLLSVAPLEREFGSFRPGLVDFSWSGLCQRLLKTIKIREIEHLNSHRLEP